MPPSSPVDLLDLDLGGRRPRRSAAAWRRPEFSWNRSRSAGRRARPPRRTPRRAAPPAPSSSATRPARSMRSSSSLTWSSASTSSPCSASRRALLLAEPVAGADGPPRAATRASRSAARACRAGRPRTRISSRRRSRSAIRASQDATSRSSKPCAAHGVVRRPALVEQPGRASTSRSRSSSPASDSSMRVELLVDLGERVGVAEADDVARSPRPCEPRRPDRVWPARVTRRPPPGRGRRRDSTQSALRAGSATWLLHPAAERRVLEEQPARHAVAVRGRGPGRSSSAPSKVRRPAQPERVDRCGEVLEPVQPAPASPGRAAQHGLDRQPPAPLLGRDVDQLGDERQLRPTAARWPARPRCAGRAAARAPARTVRPARRARSRALCGAPGAGSASP